MAWHQAETDVAEPVIAWLKNMKWEVYQEVEALAGICDIIAVQGPVVWAIEVKRQMSFDLIGQGERWLPYAHRVSVAVPAPAKWTPGRVASGKVLATLGIGLIHVRGPNLSEDRRVSIVGKAPLHRHALAATITAKLEEEHKTFAAAGSPTGNRWTPFARTCKAIREIVTEQPGISLKALVDAADHHYHTASSAKSCLSRYIQSGIVDGVEARREGRHLRMYPVAEKGGG